jgi:hypothetical protein
LWDACRLPLLCICIFVLSILAQQVVEHRAQTVGSIRRLWFAGCFACRQAVASSSVAVSGPAVFLQ